MKQISVMIKPASSLCNMRCRYCFYADVSSLREEPSFGIMDSCALTRIIDNIFVDLDAGDTLTLAFQGGEPTLAGLDYFRLAVDAVAHQNRPEVQVEYALQTNGLLLDETWCSFLRRNHFLVGLSIDGPQALHDENRVDVAGKGTFRRVLQSKRRLEWAGVDYNVLMVLTRRLARHPQQIWHLIQQENLRYVQFIPCLAPLDGTEQSYALTPRRYAEFYCSLFDLWFDAFCQGDYFSVKLFDDLVHLLAFGQCNACGLLGRCQPQIVVEADGSAYPCDFFVLDQHRLGNLAETPLRALYESEAMVRFLNRPVGRNPLCSDCPYWNICGGGCPRMRREAFCAPDADYCGHKTFLDYSAERLDRIANQYRKVTDPADISTSYTGSMR